MARKARIIGLAVDVNGQAWDVREYRPTSHGFSIVIGWPQGESRGRGGRGVAVAPTQALAEYLAFTRLKDIELPIGGTAIKRLRRELGIHWDWDVWWRSRCDDLLDLTLEEFCARYGCSIGAASQRRTALRNFAHTTGAGNGGASRSDGGTATDTPQTEPANRDRETTPARPGRREHGV